jgi:hypothetical protein
MKKESIQNLGRTLNLPSCNKSKGKRKLRKSRGIAAAGIHSKHRE